MDKTQNNNSYLPIIEDNTSSIFLINSTYSYSTYDEDFKKYGNLYYAKKGDPCVIISGTIRNDYNTTCYVLIAAFIYNESGKRVGEIITNKNPIYKFDIMRINSTEIKPFSFKIKYDKQDITRYEVVLTNKPSTEHPP